MTVADLDPIGRIALALVIGAGAAVAGRLLSRRAGWPPAGGLIALAATPLVPFAAVAAGLSLDDVLPIVGLLLLLPGLRRPGALRGRFPRVLVAAVALLVGVGILSSIVNGTSLNSALISLARGPGRVLFLAALVVVVAAAQPDRPKRLLVAQAMALMGTVEAVFGLAAFFLPLGGLGLEPARSYSVLFLEVPGRVSGTLGISPNFLGAIFILTTLLAAGLALLAKDRRARIAWWAAVTVQVFALALTFTRASLGLAIFGLVVLLLVQGRFRPLIPVALVLGLAFAITPAAQRLTGDAPDRLALWASATRMMLDRPVLGVGPGRTRYMANRFPQRYLETPFGSAVNNAHNTILLAGAETGVGGALAALVINLELAWLALRRFRRVWRIRPPPIEMAAAIALLGYLAQGMVNNLFTVGATSVVFALVVGAFLFPVDDASGDAAAEALQRQRAPSGPAVELSA
ncbi:MAG: O-antigen ligase family protein [Candidatus Limnocylindrales bacterium]